MTLIVLLPILIPLSAAVAALLLQRSLVAQRTIGLLGSAGILATGVWILAIVVDRGPIAAQAGGWPAPTGITIVADIFGAMMVVLAGLVGVAVAVYSLADIDAERESHGYHALVQVLLAGVCGAFLTGDLFNLYVWFEVMLIASFVLLALGNERAQLEGAIKYVTLNLMSSAIFLAAVGTLYGVTGTLNMADLANQVRAGAATDLTTVLAMLLLIAFGIKAAIFPLFAWLPASYHTPPVAVSALFVGLLTKVGVYAIIRVFTLIFVEDQVFIDTVILTAAGLTMLTGVLGAIARDELRRVLSLLHVSQIGYMLMGLGLHSTVALAGAVFYIAHHIIVMTNLFLISGLVKRLSGHYELGRLGGLYKPYPLLAALFLVPALSLSGFPPLSGFWAKLILVKAGLNLGQYALVAVALLVGILTLYSMIKVWNDAFWKDQPAESASRPAFLSGTAWSALVAPCVVLAAFTIAIGVAGEPLVSLSMRAAESLVDPTAYSRAVFGR